MQSERQASWAPAGRCSWALACGADSGTPDFVPESEPEAVVSVQLEGVEQTLDTGLAELTLEEREDGSTQVTVSVGLIDTDGNVLVANLPELSNAGSIAKPDGSPVELPLREGAMPSHPSCAPFSCGPQ